MNVVLLHSSGLTGAQWRKLTAELEKRGATVRAPDLTGHGRSPPLPAGEPFSFHRDVEAVEKILAELGPAHLVGHSYGGLVALHVARRASLRSLALFDPVAFAVLDPHEDADALAELPHDLEWRDDEAGRERWLETFVDFWGGAGAWRALREDARAEFRRVAWVVREGVRSLMEDTTPLDAYRTFTFPALLLTAEHSPLPARRVIQRLGQAIPNARIATIPGAGHLAPVTHADRVNAVLLEALR
jgi:pimeloyl-ACP methyl ester carboxylesterase